ncbi:unnamed protein product [Choristocarpus tenellus]
MIVSGPLETVGEVKAAMEHDWRTLNFGGKIGDPMGQKPE